MMKLVHGKVALKIDVLKIFSVLWALAMLFHVARPGMLKEVLEFQFSTIFIVPLAIAAVAVLLRPSSIRRLLALAVLSSVYLFYSLPTYINHAIMFLMIDVTIISVFIWQWARGKDPDNHRTEFFDAFAPVGRHLLLLMYFFGIFQKLNTGWLDPEVSCGVVAINSFLVPLGLNGPFTDMVAIYGTLILEAAAIIFLCTPRLKYLGFMIGIPFHLLITLFPLAWFPGFTAMVLAFYGLFLPDTFGDRLSELYARISPYRRVLVIVILAGLVGFAAILLGAYKYGPTSGSQLIAGIGKNAYWTFVCGLLLSIGIIYFALIMLYAFGFKAPATWRYWVPRPVALVVLPVIFVINGFAPYIGLKTEATISMFSNLHTEGGQTNHIFFDRPPYLFDYQSKIVRILDASPEFIDWVNNHAQREPYADGQIYLVEFDFWDYLHKNPSTSVTYEDESGIHRLERAEDVLHEHPLPWILRKIFTFKPVDFVRPKVCTH